MSAPALSSPWTRRAPAPQAAALAKAQAAADYWNAQVEEHQKECIRRHALVHSKLGASAEDQQAYQEAKDAVRSLTSQYAQAMERVNIIRGRTVSPRHHWWAPRDMHLISPARKTQSLRRSRFSLWGSTLMHSRCFR
jgi:hypothetical protein